MVTAPAAAQVTLYSDDFSGDGSIGLDGTIPDVSTSGAAWIAGSQILDNGAVTGAGDPPGARFNAFLPFTPTTPGEYTLTSVYSNPVGNLNDWMATGFASTLPPSLNQPLSSGASNGFAGPSLWALTRHLEDAGTINDRAYLGLAGGPGSSTTQGGADALTSAAQGVTITVDTTLPDWVVTWDFASDDVIDRTETVLAANVPAINYVVIGSNGEAGAPVVDSFVLTGPARANEWNIDGGGSFNTAANWRDNIVPNGVAIFGPAVTAPNAPGVVTLDSPASLSDVIFEGPSGYDIAGPSALTLTGGGVVNVTQGAHSISAPVSGSVGLTKIGAGTLALFNGSNTYTGDTQVLGGLLAVTDLGALSQSSGVTSVGEGAILQFRGDGQGGGPSGTLSEELTGPGTVQLQPLSGGGTAGLTSEVIEVASANPGFTGDFVVAGGTLQVSDSGALGTADNTADTGVRVAGQFNRGALSLNGVAVTGERLQLDGRQPGVTDPHLTSTGSSTWTGAVVGAAGGNQFSMESQSGLLTITGDITAPDTGTRTFNLSGAGNGRIEGAIVDRTLALEDGAEAGNIAVRKTGTGTWTIATTPPPEVAGTSTASDAYHWGNTEVVEGTLAVQATGGASGELFSQSINVRSGATLDLSSFTTYSFQILEDPDGAVSTGDEVGQSLGGAGTVNVGGTLRAFDDSSLNPGDGVRAGTGSLTINGSFQYDTFADTPAGSWNFGLGSNTAASDRIVVNGAATINASAASNTIDVNLTVADGTLQSGAYTVLQANSRGGTASNSTYNLVAVRDASGNDITAGIRQSVSIANVGNTVVANVTGASANLEWAGTAGDEWDIATTNNWTGGDTQYQQLDNVTFGNVANKNVSVNTSVAPGSVTFNGGSGSTYTVSGSGGMTGSGSVNVDSGTVVMQNTGNSYLGATTIASGATLQIDTGRTGGMVVSGVLSVGESGAVSSGGTQTFYQESFGGTMGDPLNGTTPDTSIDGAQWVAAPFWGEDGTIAANPNGGSATLAFDPIDGSTYVLETSITGIVGDNDWVAVGFADGQSTTAGSSHRFIANNVEGRVWSFIRGDAATNNNSSFLGDSSDDTNGGLTNGASWLVGADKRGGDVDIKITLDTSGGEGAWTALWEADLKDGNGFQVIRAETVLLDEGSIDSVGIANARSDTTGVFTNFTLTGTEPAGARLDAQTLTVDGDLVMNSNAVLELDVAFSSNDFVNVLGAASLDGTIDVSAAAGFSPANGTTYTLLSASDGITDAGVNFVLPDGFTAAIVDATDLVLTFDIGLPGDFNGDGIVNAADFTVWRDNLNTTFDLGGNGDESGSSAGLVDIADYQLWKSSFGNADQAGALGAAAPEPTAAALVLVGLSAASPRVRRRS
ncbi:MAG: autotransporter-associated beta strand repeat-containing protein [Planctomycetota bacterium]